MLSEVLQKLIQLAIDTGRAPKSNRKLLFTRSSVPLVEKDGFLSLNIDFKY